MITEDTKIIEVNPEGIPEFLKALPYWINWKPVFVDGKAKKLPTYGETVLRGQYWETEGRPFAEAVRTIPTNGGVSLLLSRQNDLACIDIDDCIPNSPRLNKILQLAPDAWCDLSPSGNGVHVWGFLPNKNTYLLPGRKTIGYHGKEYEWYGSGRGITVTGHTVCGSCLADYSGCTITGTAGRTKAGKTSASASVCGSGWVDSANRPLKMYLNTPRCTENPKAPTTFRLPSATPENAGTGIIMALKKPELFFKLSAAFRAKVRDVIGILGLPSALAAFNNRRFHIRRSLDSAISTELSLVVQGTAVAAHPFAGNRWNRIMLLRFYLFFFCRIMGRLLLLFRPGRFHFKLQHPAADGSCYRIDLKVYRKPLRFQLRFIIGEVSLVLLLN